MITLIWFTILVVALVQYLRKVYSKFSSYGVNTLKPIPIFGNAYPVLTQQRHVAHDVDLVYQGFPDDRFVGRYDILRPLVVLRDLELIKKVTVKDFEHFLDRRTMVDDELDPLFGRNLFSLRGQEWKDMRSTLSPAFTSSKIRAMVPFMVEVNNSMINVLKKKIEDSGDSHIDVDCKDLTTRYANDVIATCAFGVKVNSHLDEDNEFYQKGKATASFSFRWLLVFLGYATAPNLMKRLKVKLFTEETNIFFNSLVLSTMKEREIHRILRPDMIHLLMEAKKGKLKYDESPAEATVTGFSTVEESEIGKKSVNRAWSDSDLVAQATLFFIAGFETISTTMAFMLHELAVNPDAQDKLFNEIQGNEAKNGGKFDYNSVQNLKYLDMVVSEVLRMWPAVVGLTRLCIKDYNLGKANDKAKNDYIVRKGESVSVPVWSLHHDPKYFPNPNKFDPERFSDENKNNISPFSYAPFGVGPRNCIGTRFALCEVKVMMYQLLLNFEVSVCEKTVVPTKMASDSFNVCIKGGHWVRMKPRK